MATQPPPAPRKTRRSQTVLSPVPTEIPDGAILVHSNDSTIAVPSHGGDSVAQRVKSANPKRPTMAAIQALQGRSAQVGRTLAAAPPKKRAPRRASSGTPSDRAAPKKAKTTALSKDERTLLEFPDGPKTLTPVRPLEPVEWKGDLWCPFCFSGDKKQLCHRIPRAEVRPLKRPDLCKEPPAHFNRSIFHGHLTETHEFPPTGTRKSKPYTGEGRGSACQGNPGGKGHTGMRPQKRKDHPTEKRWRFKFRRGWRLLDVRPPWWKK